jgi:hypothetical protein
MIFGPFEKMTFYGEHPLALVDDAGLEVGVDVGSGFCLGVGVALGFDVGLVEY